MGTITADTYRRLVLLAVAAEFRRGVYGLKRYHKIMYITQRPKELPKPFTFRRYYFGQYSDEMDDVKDQLVGMRYLSALPLDTANVFTLRTPDGLVNIAMGGNRFNVQDRAELSYYVEVFRRFAPELAQAIRETVEQFGYKPEQELLDICYAFPEFKDAAVGDVIVASDLADRITVDMDEDECDSLELALTPEFVVALSTITNGLEHGQIDWDKVKVHEHPISSGA